MENKTMTEELKKQVKKFAISYWRKRNRIGDNFSVLDLINFTTDFVTEIATKELREQIEKMINEIDKTMVFSNMRECEICDIQNIFRKYNFRWNNDKWEIKEK